ncbi:MAG: fumarate hydratase C-terminal domain-containing protein [Granulosicoccus sp.]
MAEHEMTLPVTREEVERLNVGDSVYLSGQIFATAGMPTHDRLLRCLEGVEELPFDFTGGALFHLGSLIESSADGTSTIRYMNPTTSTRFNGFMPKIVPGLGLRFTGGKGGLDANCANTLRACGCVYLSFLGGGAPIITSAIQRVIAIGWPEMISHYRVVQLEVERLGPLVVGIDAKGQSIYDTTRDNALSRRAAIIEQMRIERSV